MTTLNINTVSMAQLMTIKGIGKGYAERILKAREIVGEFDSVADVLEVKGLGMKPYEALLAAGVTCITKEEEMSTKRFEDIVSLHRALASTFIVGSEFHGAKWASKRKDEIHTLWINSGRTEEDYLVALDVAKESWKQWLPEIPSALYNEDGKAIDDEELLSEYRQIKEAFFTEEPLWGKDRLAYEKATDLLFNMEDEEEEAEILAQIEDFLLPTEYHILSVVMKMLGEKDIETISAIKQAKAKAKMIMDRAKYATEELKRELMANESSEMTSKVDNLEELMDGLQAEEPDFNPDLEDSLKAINTKEPNWLHIYKMMDERELWLERLNRKLEAICEQPRNQLTKSWREETAKELRRLNKLTWDLFMNKDGMRDTMKLRGHPMAWLTKEQLGDVSRSMVMVFRTIVPHWQHIPTPIKSWSQFMKEQGRGDEATRAIRHRERTDAIRDLDLERQREWSRGDFGTTDEDGEDWTPTEIIDTSMTPEDELATYEDFVDTEF